jgi:hypothetical protein
MSRFPSLTWPGFSPAECCTSLAHGDFLGAGRSTAALDGPLSGLELRSQHRHCEPPPMSTWSNPPHSSPPGPTPSAATRCISGGPCSISELRLSRETHGCSHHFQSWQGSSTGTFFEKSTRWSERSGKSTSGTGRWFVDTFRAGVQRQPPTCCRRRRAVVLIHRRCSKLFFSSLELPYGRCPPLGTPERQDVSVLSVWIT